MWSQTIKDIFQYKTEKQHAFASIPKAYLKTTK